MSYNLTRAVVALVALATVCGAVTPAVAAVEDADATIVVGDGSAPSGETVTVPVTVEGESIAGYQANLTWDSSVLRFESVSGVDFADPVQNGGDGWLFVTQSQTDGVSSPTVVEVTFRVVGDAGDESAVSLVSRDTSANNESSQLSTALVAGSVTVSGDSDAVGTASAETTRSGTTTGAVDTGSGPSTIDATTGSTTTDTTAVAQTTAGGDGDDSGLSPMLVLAGLVGGGVVLGAGYVLGQRNGGVADADAGTE